MSTNRRYRGMLWFTGHGAILCLVRQTVTQLEEPWCSLDQSSLFVCDAFRDTREYCFFAVPQVAAQTQLA